MSTTQQTKLPPFTKIQTLDLMKQHGISAMWPVWPEEVQALINAAGQLCREQALEEVRKICGDIGPDAYKVYQAIKELK